MIQEFVIMFREMLEIVLIIGIILGYLAKTRQTKYNKVVYLGILSAIIASLMGALMFETMAGGFEGSAEQIFEGTTMLMGALLMTSMIIWMMKQEHMAEDLEQKVSVKIEEVNNVGLFMLVFVSIFREGIEIIIFLSAASFASAGNDIIGASLGIVSAIAVGYASFILFMRINLKRFFGITNIILILFAAGLIVSSAHEFDEAGIIHPLVEHVWDINPGLNPDGSYPLLHDKGNIGSILKGLFGYTGSPSLMQVLVWTVYVTAVLIVWRIGNKVHKAG